MTHHPPPDPEVRPKAKRRRFTRQYKLDILKEADSCTKTGEIEALLRREGLYSSNLAKWRQQRKAGELAGRSSSETSASGEKRIRQLEIEAELLRRQLHQAQTVIEVQKKLSDLLELPQENINRKPL